MRDLAFLLLMTTRRPVIDQTGLTGAYNFDVEFAPFDSDSPADSSAPPIFRGGLGLGLETTRAPWEGLVIDGAGEN